MEYSVPLHFAAASGKPDVEAFAIMERLLELGVDINGTDAATFGRVERVRFLLERGADPQIKNHSGRTPLDQAKKYHKLDVVEFFKGRI